MKIKATMTQADWTKGHKDFVATKNRSWSTYARPAAPRPRRRDRNPSAPGGNPEPRRILREARSPMPRAADCVDNPFVGGKIRIRGAYPDVTVV